MSVIQKAYLTNSLTHGEIADILSSDEYNKRLFYYADLTRKEHNGDGVHLKGLLEFSNICSKNCCYCGLRRQNKNLKRYMLKPKEIIGLARKAVSYGYKTIVLQSGENNIYSIDEFCCVTRSIREMGAHVTLSIGEKSENEYIAYKNAGANRYLLRIETTDEKLYKKLHPSMSHENRFECLKILKKLGYETGSGSLVGLPGQSISSIAEDILFFQKSGFDMIGIGPFISNENTPLRAAKNGSFYTALKVMAIIRLLMPKINIPASTAMETLDKNGRVIALQSGANVVMPVITEGEYRALYRLYPGKICLNDTPSHCMSCISGKIRSIGRTISQTNGDSNNFIYKTLGGAA
ncbi:MAG: [FeFe] hydrogenase H-cluster radical SAM maturase HydE [Campylobacteraceae bacterium]|jgi:biotin synthase|nr:[FeFe] hydrogenase H-cluster radical SAM maturase HydE [Campylobacteraceae bacterium]